MKKYFIMLVMLFTISANLFAEDVTAINNVEIEKYEFKVNHQKFAKFLDIAKEQIEMFDDAISELESDMDFAKTMETETSCNAIVRNALKKNIKEMHDVLNEKQYRKYLMILNLTFSNRGFNIEEISK